MPIFSKNNDHDNGGSDRRSNNNSNHRDDEDDEVLGQGGPPPDEHTRLLPNRLDSNRGLLRPDDPAVTPYNLWTVRILRYLTVLFTLVTFAWWVLQLVSAFATPPGLHTRGSGFFAFGFASLALANMAFTLLFFGVPAKSVRILAMVMAVGLPSTPPSVKLVLIARHSRVFSSSIRSSSLQSRRRGTRKAGWAPSASCGLCS